MTDVPIRRVLAVVAITALVAVGCSSDDGDEAQRDEPRDDPVVVSGAPPEATEFPGSWPMSNGDYGSTRSAPDSPITSETVDGLEVAWEAELPGAGQMGNGATNPVVVGDTVYVGDLTTSVRAFDLETGDERWAVEREGSMFGPAGAAVGWGKVFAPATEGGEGPATNIAAYDADDGEELWSTGITEPGDQVNIAPTVYDGLVLASSVGFPPGHRGILHALDEATGEIVWTFDTIDSDDLWGDPDVNAGGGAWYPPAIDTEAGVVYWGTGNPYPFPGTPDAPLGSGRPGDNLYTDSLLAVDLATGELLWYHQVIAHDLFDRDSMLTQLVPLPDGGQIVVNSGKHGRILGFDPDTHELLYDTAVGTHENDDVTEWEGDLKVFPGGTGGVVTPMAAADGVLFASVVNAPIVYRPDVTSLGFGTEFNTQDSQLVAVDAASGEIKWDIDLPGDSFGGATAVGDLVFTSVLSGQVLAFDRETGDEVWSHQLEGGINGWPAVADDTIIVPVGLGPTAKLVAFRLP